MQTLFTTDFSTEQKIGNIVSTLMIRVFNLLKYENIVSTLMIRVFNLLKYSYAISIQTR